MTIDFVPGEAVVIVGANGSGKTTLGTILSNIHRPQKGCVMYGSSIIGGYTARSVLEHALVIPQSGNLYDLPLSESLFGVMDMSGIDVDRYTKAAMMSGAKEVLDRLPNGIHTQIGTAFKGGINRSGGEMQRLRLAGFFYKALDPRIAFIIADEPSRHLDPKTRNRVYSELIALARDHGKVVLVISHDADLEKFDRVIILEKGRVDTDQRGEKIAEVVRVVSKRLAGDLAQNKEH
jgi:ATP-binding cassette subfamily B protein